MEYIQGGCQIQLVIGVGLSSRYSKKDENSNCDEDQCGQILRSVMEILQYYDDDKMYPIYGFGAKVDLGISYPKVTSQCLALNGDVFNPEVSGLEETIGTYKASLDILKI